MPASPSSRGRGPAPVVAPEELAGLRGQTVLVTGADGMLGRAFTEALADVGEVRVLSLAHATLDVTDRRAVLALAECAPDVILHCAGMALADRCEREPERAHAVHVDGTRAVADLANATGARVFYPQSVFIFDGRELPVTEHTRPHPTFVYGRVKLEAETNLLRDVPRALSVRMAGFFGGDDKDKNFVGKFVRELAGALAAGAQVIGVGSRVWQPTYTLDLARNTLLLLARESTGVYHMGALGEATFFDVARVCVDALGWGDRIRVESREPPVDSATEPARRPARMVTANDRLLAEGLLRQRHWEPALREYLDRPFFDRYRRAAAR